MEPSPDCPEDRLSGAAAQDGVHPWTSMSLRSTAESTSRALEGELQPCFHRHSEHAGGTKDTPVLQANTPGSPLGCGRQGNLDVRPS